MASEKSLIVTFFYPSKIIGGAELLFLRMATNLSQSSNISVQYVDYCDGFVASEISKNNLKIEIIPFLDNKRILLKTNSLLVTPLSSIFQVTRIFNKELFVLFWSIHPIGLKEAIDKLPSYMPKISYDGYGKDLTLLIKMKGLFFMDKPNYIIQKNIFEFQQSGVNYLPIFSSNVIKLKEYRSPHPSAFYLGWLGRLCIEKVNSLLNVISHCNDYLAMRPNEKIVFYIIGEGDKKSMIQNCQIHENLELKFLGVLSGENLSDFMISKIDLMFAMGTSTLEAASLNIATILVDFSYNTIPIKNRFRFLYESEGFSVADEYHVNNTYKHQFSNLLDRLKSGEIVTDAEKCRDYCLLNHSEQSVVSKFKSVIPEVQVRLSDVNTSIFGKYRQLFLIKSIYFEIRRWLGI